MYALGIDLGTTFTAAATWRDGRAEVAPLGSRTAAIPSVVLLRDDETVLTGETASRRALTEPHRVAREFKRRLGDTTPIMLGGVPYSAEALTGRLLRAVVDEVTTREGGAPASICVSHPANWGEYKMDLLRQALRIADLTQPATLITEPEAAAIFYAQQQRMDPGALIAVYDLGGGTFDAAVLRKGTSGFTLLGQPEGIERLGGIDFDAAVFSHVARALDGALADLDEDDPTVITAVARLREECTDAKEALSSDTDVTIPVLLPQLSTEVRLTRGELEAMVRPALHDSIEALRRALRSAGVTPEQLHAVLLVGGSSRMPIVGQLVGAELGRPVAVDTHPKHAVALGAAWLASGRAGMQAPTPPAGAVPPTGFVAAGAAVMAAAVPADPTPHIESPSGIESAPRADPEPRVDPVPFSTAATPPTTPAEPAVHTAFIVPPRTTPTPPAPPMFAASAALEARSGSNGRRVLGGTIVALVLVLGGLAAANALIDGGDPGQEVTGGTTSSATRSVPQSAAQSASTAPAQTAPAGGGAGAGANANGGGGGGGAGQGGGGKATTVTRTTHPSASPTISHSPTPTTPTPTVTTTTTSPTSHPSPTASQPAPSPTKTLTKPPSLRPVTISLRPVQASP